MQQRKRLTGETELPKEGIGNIKYRRGIKEAKILSKQLDQLKPIINEINQELDQIRFNSDPKIRQLYTLKEKESEQNKEIYREFYDFIINEIFTLYTNDEIPRS